MSNIIKNKNEFKSEDCINLFKKEFADNLFAIISVGSLTTEHYIKEWSDIDLLIVLDKLSLDEKIKISVIKKTLEDTYQCRFGINVIKTNEALKPLLPETFLDGKTLQGLLELSLYPKRLIYCSSKDASFFVPNKELVRKYSFANIAMFLLRNRKTLTSNIGTDIKKLKFTTEKEIRASFIITMLAIQYKGLTSNGHEDTIKKAEKVFPNFDFISLKNNEKNIQMWKDINSEKDIFSILKNTDEYIESFSRYILENH